jgi:hypothetical protein
MKVCAGNEVTCTQLEDCMGTRILMGHIKIKKSITQNRHS